MAARNHLVEMTLRIRAIELLQQGCAHERNDAGACRRPGAHGRDIDVLLANPEVLRALAGEVPAPLGDVPPVWWSPMFGPIEESSDRNGDKYVGFSRQSFSWVGLAELPADAVRLVPAGSSAPADPAEQCGVIIQLQGLGDFPCVIPHDGTSGAHGGDCITQPERDGTWPPAGARQ